jgi:hypothetical protein
MSAAATARYADPAARASQSEIAKAAATPEARLRNSEAQRARYENPAERERMRVKALAYHARRRATYEKGTP